MKRPVRPEFETRQEPALGGTRIDGEGGVDPGNDGDDERDDWIRLPDGERIAQLEDLLEWIANAGPDDEAGIRADIKRNYHDFGYRRASDAMMSALDAVLAPGADRSVREAVLQRCERYTRRDPNAVDRTERGLESQPLFRVPAHPPQADHWPPPPFSWRRFFRVLIHGTGALDMPPDGQGGQAAAFRLYLRQEKVFLPTTAFHGDDRYFADDPVSVIDLGDAAALGQTLRTVLSRGNRIRKLPADDLGCPLLAASQLQTWSEFEEGLQQWTVTLAGGRYRIFPMVHLGDEGWEPHIAGRIDGGRSSIEAAERLIAVLQAASRELPPPEQDDP
jgi:hypothetical protein